MMRKCSKLPLLILFGVVTAFLFVLRPSKASHGPDLRAETALLAFIAAFLVICEVIDRGPAFTGAGLRGSRRYWIRLAVARVAGA